jgi:hypothetical protein
MPYLSISHYSDLEGKAVPGMVDAVYIDGDCQKACFKSKGTFSDTPIGRAAFEAVRDNPNQPEDNKVRVSIGFLDWAHVHKSNNYKFMREDVDDICPECWKEMLKGKSKGKIYLAGQLVHEALTRVPANKRTEMEVDKSMTTRKEDASTIIGEELAEKLEKEAKLVGKSEALVIKADDDDDAEPIPVGDVEIEESTTEEECPDGMDKEECKKWRKQHKKQEGGRNGKTPIVEAPTARPSKSETAEEPCDCDDPANMEKEKCKGKKKEKSDFEELKAELLEIKSLLTPKPTTETDEVKTHVLDASIAKLKADFDDAVTVSNLSVDDRLKLLQPSFEQLGEVVKEKVSISVIPAQEPVQTNVQNVTSDLAKSLADVLQPLYQQLSLLSAQVTELKRQPTVVAPQPVVVPNRISLDPKLIQQRSTVVKSETPKLRAIIEQTT